MIQALIFDVFGTCVDWRTSVAHEVSKVLPQVDAVAFATAWRAEYEPAMARVSGGAREYVPLDVLHLENLLSVCRDFDVRLKRPEELNTAWEKLTPWPDVVQGLNEMKRDRIIAPCSNGSVALMTRLARHAGLPWDCILGADLAQDYKPQPAVYLQSCAALRLRPEQVVMVAAHNSDLSATRALGLKTAFVPRLTEHRPDQQTDLRPEESWDFVAEDFADLARQVSSFA